ncbi:MAG: cation diffusion facilitator family transporter [Synechococcaceae cyanobacterium]|nr:cation diffusion facilitator family transporter [Synechococcaceae cyanobacterium]
MRQTASGEDPSHAEASSPSGESGDAHDPGPSHPEAHVHSHSHSHPHSHGMEPSGPGGRRSAAAFRWSIALNSGLTALQLLVGFAFGSLALIGDALHNLGDVVGLVLGWGADQLSRRPARGRFTYGFGRSTQMVSLVNGLLIFSAGVVVVVEAIQRLFDPVPLEPTPVAWAAAAGIVVNLLSARLFGHGHQHDLNQRAAVLHLLTDAAVSVAVLVSAVLVAFTGWPWLDAATAIGVGLAVSWSALGLLREAIALNLDAAPRHVDLSQVERTLASLPGVRAVEELHVWGLSTSRTALTAHLRVEAAALEGAGGRRDQLLALARERLGALGIRKSTLQLECGAAPLEQGSGTATESRP